MLAVIEAQRMVRKRQDKMISSLEILIRNLIRLGRWFGRDSHLNERVCSGLKLIII